MKKVLSSLLASALVAGAIGITASAESATTDVYVTISDAEGKLALVQEKVTVTDLDEDGILTVDEALYAAHEAKFDGGAEAGYASSDSDYGRMLNKLWGIDNGGSYGYYVNNASAMSLSDEVKSGDYINAFVYTDTVTWNDLYSYFDVNSASVEEGEEVTLTVFGTDYLEGTGYMEFSLAGASIIINNEATEYVTDDEGKITIPMNEAGTYVISVNTTFGETVLVPPACVVTVSEKAEDPDAGDNNEGTEDDGNEGTEDDGNEGTEDDSNEGATGDNNEGAEDDGNDDETSDNPDTGVVLSAVSVLALGVALLTRKSYEK